MRAPPSSFRLSGRWVPTAFLARVLALFMLGSLSLGAGDVSFGDTLQVLTGRPASEDAYFVVSQLRWPRTLLGIMVGAGLGLAGAVLQAATRNPLAEPGLLGVSAGASFAVVLAISLGAAAATVHLGVAVAGALAGCFLVLLVTRIRDVGDDPVRLVLAGAAFTGILNSLSSLILLQDQRSADEIRFWIIGALGGRPAETLYWAAPGMLLGALVLLPVIRPLAALALGEKLATGLGHNPRLTRAWALVGVAILVGTATAAAGPIAFIGLVVPFVARRVTGPDIRNMLGVCLLTGPVILLAADIVSRLVIRPYELPIGVVTAFVGAPVLIAIVRGHRLPSL
jgi:iron complex transport system permease protein